MAAVGLIMDIFFDCTVNKCALFCLSYIKVCPFTVNFYYKVQMICPCEQEMKPNFPSRVYYRFEISALTYKIKM